MPLPRVIRNLAYMLVICVAPFTSGCRCHRANMDVQPKYKPLDPSVFFADGQSARPLVAGTVSRGPLRTDQLLFTGRTDGRLSEVFPFPVTRQVLERGRQRYNIFCSVCHGQTGDGNGMIVQRGFIRPPSYHIDRLREGGKDGQVGHFFDVITNGLGAMYSYGERVSPEDRWAIVAYIRSLQLSQHATLQDVPPAERQKLEEQKP